MLNPARLDTSARSTGLTVQVVSTPEDLRALRPEWDQLYGIAGSDNPFNQWLWVWHWWQAFGRSERFRRYRLHVCVMRDGDGRTRAIVPLVLTTWGWGLLSARALRLYGFRDPLSELRAPLICPGWETSVAEAFREMLDAQAALYDWCVLDGLPAGGRSPTGSTPMMGAVPGRSRCRTTSCRCRRPGRRCARACRAA